MNKRTDDTWRDPEAARRFLRDINGGISLEAEQLDIMMRLIRHQKDDVKRFLRKFVCRINRGHFWISCS